MAVVQPTEDYVRLRDRVRAQAGLGDLRDSGPHRGRGALHGEYCLSRCRDSRRSKPTGAAKAVRGGRRAPDQQARDDADRAAGAPGRSHPRHRVPREASSPGTGRTKGSVPQPDAAHFELVLRHMIDQGDLVAFLGSRLAGRTCRPAGRASWSQKRLPRTWHKQFDMEATRAGPARGRPVRIRDQGQSRPLPGAEEDPHLRTATRDRCTGSWLGFLETLEELGLEKRYQLIVSTSFDTALEQAFDDEQEPYDLAVYMASGDDKGKFVHFPYGGDAHRQSLSRTHTASSDRETTELEQTVIVKIHGAVDGKSAITAGKTTMSSPRTTTSTT